MNDGHSYNFTLINSIDQTLQTFYSSKISYEQRKELDKNLTNFSNNLANIDILSQILEGDYSNNLKFFASNSLLNIITSNYLSIDFVFKERIFLNQLKYIFSKSEELWNNTNNSYLLKSLIQLLARIVRIDYLKNPIYQKIVLSELNALYCLLGNFSSLIFVEMEFKFSFEKGNLAKRSFNVTLLAVSTVNIVISWRNFHLY